MKFKLTNRIDSQRFFLFYFVFGLWRKWNKYKRKIFRYKLFLPNFKKAIENIDIVLELKRVIPLMNDYCLAINLYEKDIIIREAKNVLANKFSVFNMIDIELNPIPWHKDINSGFEWKKGKFYNNYVQVDLANNADVKFPRELSRSHFLLYLGEAYLLTKNEKYAEKVVELILDWINENPFMYSINWGCAMDVAIRGINQLYAVRMILESKSITLEFVRAITESAYQHAWYVFNNQEVNYYNNANHYDSNIAGMLFYGLLFNKKSKGKKWFLHAKEEFFFEARQQILPTGVVYEKSINYGRLITEMFTFCFTLLKNNNLFIPNDISHRIETQFEFIMNYTKPNGLAPVIGDLDDARWLPFTPLKKRNHRHLLSLGAAIFKRGDFKKYSLGYISDVFFLINGFSNIDFDKIEEINNPLNSCSFKDAGYFIARSQDIYLFINHAGISKYQDKQGDNYFGSHTHADLLSFELTFQNITYLVDPGSYVYTSNPKARNHFRSTCMHNTIQIDSYDQLVLKEKDLFGYYSNIFPNLLHWESNQLYDVFIGDHNGYERLEDPVTHRRKITLNKQTQSIEIIDFLLGAENHDIDIFFHFNADIDFNLINKNTVQTNILNNPNLNMHFNCKNDFTLIKYNSFVSKKYGVKQRSKSLKVTFERAQLPLEIKTLLRFI
jgi:hypothetical protein